jgi:hypothetical protein
MIHIDLYLKRLDYLQQWINKEIDYSNLWYGFSSYIYTSGRENGYNLRKFNDFCAYKEWNELQPLPGWTMDELSIK